MHQMVRVIGFEGVMMDQRVRLEGVTEIKKWPVHDITMQRPLEERSKNNPAGKARRRPKHQLFNKRHNDEVNREYLPDSRQNYKFIVVNCQKFRTKNNEFNVTIPLRFGFNMSGSDIANDAKAS